MCYSVTHILSHIEFCLFGSGSDLRAYFRFKVSSAHNITTLQVGISADRLYGDFDGYLDNWKTLDIMFGRLRSELLEVCTQVVFGFHKRKNMVHFAENVLGQLPSISEHFTVQYSVFSRKEEGYHYWYQASLDSEELRGASPELTEVLENILTPRHRRAEKRIARCLSMTSFG